MFNNVDLGFQSLLGRLKTKQKQRWKHIYEMFQSLLGRLKTLRKISAVPDRFVGFNPS